MVTTQPGACKAERWDPARINVLDPAPGLPEPPENHRRFSRLCVIATAAHHTIELAAGIGVPGEPMLGRRRALADRALQ